MLDKIDSTDIKAKYIQFKPDVEIQGFVDVKISIYKKEGIFNDETSHYVTQGLLSKYNSGHEIRLYYKSNNFRIALFLKNNEATFGLFEATDNLILCQSFFDLISKQLGALGIKNFIGPVDFSTFHNYRIQEFTSLNERTIGEPYHPTYYGQLLRNCGAEPIHEYQSLYFPKNKTSSTIKKIKEGLKLPSKTAQMSHQKLDIKTINGSLSDKILQLVNVAFGVNPLFEPISQVDFKEKYLKEYLKHLDSERSNAIFIDHQLVAFILIYKQDTYRKEFPSKEEFDHDISIVKTICIDPKYRNIGLPYLLFHNAKIGQSSIFYSLLADKQLVKFLDINEEGIKRKYSLLSFSI